MYRFWVRAFVSTWEKAIAPWVHQSTPAEMHFPLLRECSSGIFWEMLYPISPSSIQVWIRPLIVGLILETLVIYRFYIIYIFYNPYLLLIIPNIITPHIQFTATQKIKREIDPPTGC